MSTHRLKEEDLSVFIRRKGFRVKVLAVHVGLGMRTLERQFQEQYSTTPKHWIMLERIKCAPPLLANGLLNKQVASSLGYTCESNFCRDFKKHFGCAPQKFAQVRRSSSGGVVF